MYKATIFTLALVCATLVAAGKLLAPLAALFNYRSMND